MKSFRVAMAIALCCAPIVGSAESYHVYKAVYVVHSPDSRPCAFFQLTGVTEADPVLPDNPWFAVATSHSGFKEIMAMLLAARLSGNTVSVRTDGKVACGHASVLTLLL